MPTRSAIIEINWPTPENLTKVKKIIRATKLD